MYVFPDSIVSIGFEWEQVAGEWWLKTKGPTYKVEGDRLVKCGKKLYPMDEKCTLETVDVSKMMIVT